MHEVRALAPDDDLAPLVDAHVAELDAKGGDVPHTPESVRGILAAVEKGVCMVAGNPAIAWTAAQELPTPWPTKHGKIAMSIGTYVSPQHRRSGIARSLRLALQDELARQGFDTLVGGVHMSNVAGNASLTEDIGFTPYQILGYRRLS